MIAAVAAVFAALSLAAAGWVTYETATYIPARHEDTSLIGVGYVVAVVIAAPAAVAAALAGIGLALARRRRGGWALGMAIAALVAMLPVAYLVWVFLGLGRAGL